MQLTSNPTPITFKAATYKVGEQNTVSFQDVNLNSALISITFTKKLVRGDVMGRAGEVTEYMGQGPCDINIYGSLTGANGVRPIDDILELTKVINAPIALDVVCPFLNQLGVHKIVISDATFPQDPGGVSYQNYTISAFSEYPIELRISGV